MGSTEIVAAFNTLTRNWRKVGQLQEARHGLGVILNKGKFIVVGGSYGQSEIERCSFKDELIHCELVGAVLQDFVHPEVMRVPFNYCQKDIDE